MAVLANLRASVVCDVCCEFVCVRPFVNGRVSALVSVPGGSKSVSCQIDGDCFCDSCCVRLIFFLEVARGCLPRVLLTSVVRCDVLCCLLFIFFDVVSYVFY